MQRGLHGEGLGFRAWGLEGVLRFKGLRVARFSFFFFFGCGVRGSGRFSGSVEFPWV